ncbi:hypothetical protein ACFL2U_03090 [Patescibacteria group bacterium]
MDKKNKQAKSIISILAVLFIAYIIYKVSTLLNQQDIGEAVIKSLITLVIVGGALYAFFISPKKIKARIEKLKASGLKIQASFLKVEGRDYNGHQGIYNRFVIKTKGIDPISQKDTIFTSLLLPNKNKVLPGENIPQKLDVYIDAQDSNNYYVDTSFLNK